jgi:SPOR domain
MTDSRQAYDEQLPWLEAVDDEDGPAGIPPRKMLAALLVVLAAAALVSGTFFWLGRQAGSPAGGAPELIRAEPGPYKVKPPNPGGLDVAGESQTAFETSAGQDTDAQIDLSKAPEAAAVAPPKTAEPATKPEPAPAAKPAKAEPEKAAAPTGGKGSVIQLGAFANRAQAERAWSALSARFPSIAATNKMIVPFPGGIRLRAAAGSPGDARQACQTLKAAGENCFVAN